MHVSALGHVNQCICRHTTGQQLQSLVARPLSGEVVWPHETEGILWKVTRWGCSGEEKYSKQDVESEMEEECIGMEEVTAAIAKLKKGRAPGVCGISAKMLKARGRVVAEWLHMIINLM